LEKHTATAHAAARQVIDARRPVIVPPYEMTNTALAVWNHAYVVPGAWIVGVAVDFLSFVLLLVLSLRVAATEEPADRRAGSWAGEVEQAERRDWLSGRPGFEPKPRAMADGAVGEVDEPLPNGHRMVTTKPGG
jgi:hypothetical protein